MLTYLGARREAGDGVAALLGLAFLLPPVVQRFGHMVMTELPLALFCTVAVMRFGAFLERGRARDALAFGLFAALGILTPRAARSSWPWCRRFPSPSPAAGTSCAGRRLWGSAALVVALCAPWYLATIQVSTSSWVGGATPNLEHAIPAARFYSIELLRIAGWVCGGLALVGFGAALFGPLRRGRWAAYAAWVPSLVLCHLVVSTGPQARHLILVVPVWAHGRRPRRARADGPLSAADPRGESPGSPGTRWRRWPWRSPWSPSCGWSARTAAATARRPEPCSPMKPSRAGS